MFEILNRKTKTTNEKYNSNINNTQITSLLATNGISQYYNKLSQYVFFKLCKEKCIANEQKCLNSVLGSIQKVKILVIFIQRGTVLCTLVSQSLTKDSHLPFIRKYVLQPFPSKIHYPPRQWFSLVYIFVQEITLICNKFFGTNSKFVL